MPPLKHLLHDVAMARRSFIASASGLNDEQVAFKPEGDAWCVTENVEHMFWAEHGGINGMWKAFDAFKAGKPLFAGEPIHHRQPIEYIIAKTWKEKEQVPEVAKPRLGGNIGFWIISLNGLQTTLEGLAGALGDHDLEKIIHPHPISGPLNVIQRFEFLCFHLNRHQKQIENIKKHSGFPH